MRRFPRRPGELQGTLPKYAVVVNLQTCVRQICDAQIEGTHPEAHIAIFVSVRTAKGPSKFPASCYLVQTDHFKSMIGRKIKTVVVLIVGCFSVLYFSCSSSLKR